MFPLAYLQKLVQNVQFECYILVSMYSYYMEQQVLKLYSSLY